MPDVSSWIAVCRCLGWLAPTVPDAALAACAAVAPDAPDQPRLEGRELPGGTWQPLCAGPLPTEGFPGRLPGRDADGTWRACPRNRWKPGCPATARPSRRTGPMEPDPGALPL